MFTTAKRGQGGSYSREGWLSVWCMGSYSRVQNGGGGGILLNKVPFSCSFNLGSPGGVEEGDSRFSSERRKRRAGARRNGRFASSTSPAAFRGSVVPLATMSSDAFLEEIQRDEDSQQHAFSTGPPHSPPSPSSRLQGPKMVPMSSLYSPQRSLMDSNARRRASLGVEFSDF